MKPTEFAVLVFEQMKTLVERSRAGIIADIERRLEAVPRISEAAIDRSGNLILLRSDGTTQDLGRVVGADAVAPDLEAIATRAAALVRVEPPPPSEDLVRSWIHAAIAEQPVPRDGKSVTLEDVEPLIAEAVTKAIAAIPAPKDGKSIEPEVVRAMVAEAVAKLPAPRHGKDADPEVTAALVQRQVEAAVAAIPTPKDGRSVEPGEVELIARRLLDQLPKPRDGKDGVATREELEATVREFVARSVPEVVERAVTEAIKSVPKMEYHGIWQEGEFTKGDCATWGGSLWICRAERTTDKPGTSDAWQLAVKKGRDGRSA